LNEKPHIPEKEAAALYVGSGTKVAEQFFHERRTPEKREVKRVTVSNAGPPVETTWSVRIRQRRTCEEGDAGTISSKAGEGGQKCADAPVEGRIKENATTLGNENGPREGGRGNRHMLLS